MVQWWFWQVNAGGRGSQGHKVQRLQPSLWWKGIDTEGILINNATRAATNSCLCLAVLGFGIPLTTTKQAKTRPNAFQPASTRSQSWNCRNGIRVPRIPLCLEFLVGGLPLLEQHRQLLRHLRLEVQHGVERVGATGRQNYVSPRLPQHGHLSDGVSVHHHCRSGEGTGKSCGETHVV